MDRDGFSLHIFFYNANMGLHLLASPDLLMEHPSKYIVIANLFLQSESIKGIVSRDEYYFEGPKIQISPSSVYVSMLFYLFFVKMEFKFFLTYMKPLTNFEDPHSETLFKNAVRRW